MQLEDKLGAKAFLLSDILRILTPEEISHLTTTSESDGRTPLTEVIKMYQRGELSDFGQRLAPKQKPSVEEQGNILSFPSAPSGDEALPSGEGAQQATAPPIRPSESREEESSNFILSQKKRFEEVRSKIREREVLKSYQKSAALDLQAERSLREDLSKSSQVGTLINKKQA